jgi:acetyltransferase
MTDGMDRITGASGKTLEDEVIAEARRLGMRVLGPNGIGLLNPAIGLNASFAARPARAGKIAFVSQSGALCNAVLDWADAHNVGFSHFISMGAGIDIDFGDVLDYLGSDPHTAAIMLYIESIRDARKFISAARAASRNKPVLAIKSGRSREGARAAMSHTGVLAGTDSVYDAALRRAGVLRVHDFDEIFEAVGTLGHVAAGPARGARGERLAVLTNAGALGILTADALASRGGTLAVLTDDTLKSLDGFLPVGWSQGNPVDIGGHAAPERYAQALQVLLKAAEVDAVMVMHAPMSLTDPIEVAKAVAEVARGGGKAKTVSTCWVGDSSVEAARHLFEAAHIPSYESPEQAVRAFMHLVQYRRNQEILMQTPASLPKFFRPDAERARTIIRRAIDRGNVVLDEAESKEILATYGIPVVETRVAACSEEAVHVANTLGYPVALKILSDDIVHKSDVGGVVLDLKSPEEVLTAACDMLDRVTATYPQARIRGFTVQQMTRRPGSHELIVGIADDAVFGPVILFGQGGTEVELIKDSAVGMPPLNMALARDLMSQTRVVRLLEGHRGRPAADQEAVAATLCRVSQLICDIPEVLELDINPLVCDAQGVIALDARIKVAAVAAKQSRLAIRPYPKELEEDFLMRDGRQVVLRPIRPEDEPAHHDFHARLSPDDIRLRHFAFVKEIVHSQMARLTQIDYDREMAFIGTWEGETLGVVRVALDLDKETAEFSIIIRSDLKQTGLGKALFEKMIRYCRSRGVRTIMGQTMRENRRMQQLAEKFGFSLHRDDEGMVEMIKIYDDDLAAAAE